MPITVSQSITDTSAQHVSSQYPPQFSFFSNDTATTEIYTLSLHDALPISKPTSTTTNENRRRFPGVREQVRDREGHALHALGARGGPRHHQLVLRREPAHGGAQVLAAARRQGGVPEP